MKNERTFQWDHNWKFPNAFCYYLAKKKNKTDKKINMEQKLLLESHLFESNYTNANYGQTEQMAAQRQIYIRNKSPI